MMSSTKAMFVVRVVPVAIACGCVGGFLCLPWRVDGNEGKAKTTTIAKPSPSASKSPQPSTVVNKTPKPIPATSKSKPIQPKPISNEVKTKTTTTAKPTSPAAKPAPASPQIAIDTTIVPGQRVGAITPQTTYADLVKIYGKQRLASKKVYGAEGQTVFPGTVIKLGPNKSLTVAWKDAKQTQPLSVEIKDYAYKTPTGIGLGTSLDKLRQILGEFKITGLYWDYGNTVIDLAPAVQDRYRGLMIHVDADRFAARQFPKQLRAVTGDGVTPRSNDPAWKPLKMRVSALSVYFQADKSAK